MKGGNSKRKARPSKVASLGTSKREEIRRFIVLKTRSFLTYLYDKDFPDFISSKFQSFEIVIGMKPFSDRGRTGRRKAVTSKDASGSLTGCY